MTMMLSMLLSLSNVSAAPGDTLEDMVEHLDTLDSLLPAANTPQVRRLMEDELDDLRHELERVMEGKIACPPPLVAPIAVVSPPPLQCSPRGTRASCPAQSSKTC